MVDGKPNNNGTPTERQIALSRWDTEGGAGPDGPQESSTSGQLQADVSQPTNIELVQLRIRIIALENLVITLLAEASDRQLMLVREMAEFILPRPGFTQHPLTIHAAAQMIDLVERSGQFRVKQPS